MQVLVYFSELGVQFMGIVCIVAVCLLIGDVCTIYSCVLLISMVCLFGIGLFSVFRDCGRCRKR